VKQSLPFLNNKNFGSTLKAKLKTVNYLNSKKLSLLMYPPQLHQWNTVSNLIIPQRQRNAIHKK
jgi:hypothetical protein